MTRWPGRIAAMLAAILSLGLVTVPMAAAAPVPRDEEWWFTSWAIDNKVWPHTQGEGVTVALLDTGVNAALAELAGAVLPGTDATGGGGDGRTDTGAASQSRGHGTAMAALIAGQGGHTSMVGVAPRARILPIVVNNSAGGPGLQATLPSALRNAADRGAKVINISQGSDATTYPGRCPPEVQEAVRYALRRDAVVVAGAGNSGDAGNAPEFPASCQGVVAVGAMYADFRVWERSQHHDYVSVSAPGVLVGSVYADGRFLVSSGTSTASALTAGAMALVRARFPDMPAPEVVQRILGTVRDIGPPGRDDASGYGVARPHHAVVRGAPAGARYPVVEQMRALAAAPTPPAPVATETGPTRTGDRGDKINSIFPLGGFVIVLAVMAAVVILITRQASSK